MIYLSSRRITRRSAQRFKRVCGSNFGHQSPTFLSSINTYLGPKLSASSHFACTYFLCYLLFTFLLGARKIILIIIKLEVGEQSRKNTKKYVYVLPAHTMYQLRADKYGNGVASAPGAKMPREGCLGIGPDPAKWVL